MQKEKKETKVCQRCLGYRSVDTDENSLDVSTPFIPISKTCPRCKGTGIE